MTAHDDERRRRVPAAAEMISWQNRIRVGAALGIAGVGAALRAAGVLALPGASPGAPLLDDSARALLASALTAAYLLVVTLVQARLRRRAAATRATVVVLSAADLAVVYGTTFLLVPPAHYARALIVVVFVLQLMQMYWRRRGAVALLACAGALHAALLAAAHATGAVVAWGQELWTLALFTITAGGFVLLQGDVVRRLDVLTSLFERAQEGDFAGSYDETADRRPDSITRVGRAYNRMRAQLATIVLTDPLSGCLNRRGFDQALARELARASRAGAEVAVLAVDVDYFKRINDTFGHGAGDAVIAEVGQLLRETARTGDVVARVGGEEFMLLAPDTNAPGAFNLATRIVEAFRRRAFAGVQGRIPVTVSIGAVSDRARDEHAAEALRSRADEALYTAKRRGRNRVALWTPSDTDGPVLPAPG